MREEGPEFWLGGNQAWNGQMLRKSTPVCVGSTIYPRIKTDNTRPSASESNFSHLSTSTHSSAVRDTSNRLASLSISSFNSRPRRISSSSQQPQIPSDHPSFSPEIQPRPSFDTRSYRPANSSNLKVTNNYKSQSASPDLPTSVGHVGPSGLSVMLERDEERKRQASQLNLKEAAEPTVEDGEEDTEDTPVPRHVRLASMGNQSESTDQATTIIKHDSLADEVEGEVNYEDDDEHNASSALRRYLSDGGDLERADEETPLLSRPKLAAKGVGETLGDWKRRASKITGRDVVQGVIVEPIALLPATILGLLLNVLDGVSYGMIL